MLLTILGWYTFLFICASLLSIISDNGKPKTPTTPKVRLFSVLILIPVLLFSLLYLFN